MPEDLNAMAVFAAVAQARGFRAAGERLGVTASAVSRTLRKLEERLGVALVRRTTRSVASPRPASGSTPPWARRWRRSGRPSPC